jgi:4-diphosphocytidyl-2-C-methyl-D-erythritol kinase
VERAAFFEIASNIGADVPFFLLGGRALATGTGTTVNSIADYDQKHLIVVTPKASVATAEAYAALDAAALTTNNADFILASSREEANLHDSNPWDSRDDLSNDFESVIFDKEPEIRRAKEALLQAGASSALLAGSGSSVFGVFENQQAQHRAAYKIASEAGWRIFPCVTLSRNEYLRELTSNGIHSYALSTLDNTGA